MSTLIARDLCVMRAGQPVLHGVRAQFAPGEVTVVLGPNGAGKSTLLAALGGLIRAESGEVLLGARAIEHYGRGERGRLIGYLPQNADVHWDVDVEALVALGRYPHRGRWGAGAGDAQAIARAMAATDCARFAGRRVSALSGGERARVLLARVLAGEPRWLLADEPLANLDPAHQLRTLGVLREAAGAGAGVVVVLHDLNLAMRLADKLLLLHEGRVVAHGPPATVLTPARIAQAYGIAAHMGATPDGRAYIIPMASMPATI